jgi:hypothetical protein
VILQNKFGADDFRSAINDLLALKQTGTVEDYTIAFQALQYDISMHNSNYDELFFASKYVDGLKDEIIAVVEPTGTCDCGLSSTDSKNPTKNTREGQDETSESTSFQQKPATQKRYSSSTDQL